MERMGFLGEPFVRIVFITDVHHDFKSLAAVLKETDADLYLIAGDLVSRAFYRYQTAWRFMELQQILAGYRPHGPESLYEIVEKLYQEGNSPLLMDQAREYLELCRKAEVYLKKAYTQLEQILVGVEKPVYVLPGNYDMDLQGTALCRRDLHLKTVEVEGVHLAGYGGANVQTPGIPDHLQVPYPEWRGDSALGAGDPFGRVNPDLLMLHQPPFGYLDYLPARGHMGSVRVRNYLDEGHVKVVLSGHLHEQWGGIRAEGTCLFNPSNFGRTVEVSRVREGGYFLDFILGPEGVGVATLRQLDRGRIYDILDYKPGPSGMEALLLDEKRYVRLGGKAPRAHHIRPIRQLQRIKSFFLGYETPETLQLMNELRGIYREIRHQGMEVAFDLLGSLNFGMAGDTSDMDVVVYMRSRDCVLDSEDTCGVPRPLAAVFDALKERHLEVEVCDSLDLDRIQEAIERDDPEDGQLQRFVFYRLVCRPVNLRLIKGVENFLLQKEAFRRRMEQGLEQYLEILVSSVRHVRSFEKYKARLQERGVAMAPDVEEAIRHYLKG